MATYIIGDVHGCFDSLQILLSKINYNPGKDILWFTGDLINRGPKNIEVLDFIYNNPNAIVILGNHDLHFLAQAANVGSKYPNDLKELIQHKNSKKWASWLRSMPLTHCEHNICISHAGIYPGWTITKAQQLATDVHDELQGPSYINLLKNMYGNMPNIWHEGLSGIPRLRFIINAFVRMRYLTKEGVCDFENSMHPDDKPAHLIPWYEHHAQCFEEDYSIVFGHWASLQASISKNRIYAIDGGCVWGKELVAFCIKTKTKIKVNSAEK